MPIKIFVLNNGGYLSIRSTQKNFFGRVMGESPSSGVSFPDFVKVGDAYGIPSVRVERAAEMDKVQAALASSGPALIEVMLDPQQEFEPRSRSKVLPDGTIVSPPLEDMYPFLSHGGTGGEHDWPQVIGKLAARCSRGWIERWRIVTSIGTGSLMTGADFFNELFVLEMANNHLGSVERGLKIIGAYGQVVRFNNVRAAIKIQIRDVDNFIHRDFRGRSDIRYIKKTLDTQLSFDDYATLVKAIREANCISMATPFDEYSVDVCCKLGIQILKIASSDLNDWMLIEKIATAKKPVIVSTGGSSLKDIDDLVQFFDNRHIPLAINHCVSLYPSEDHELEMNQIDFLRDRYPDHVIGFSTHECSRLELLDADRLCQGRTHL